MTRFLKKKVFYIISSFAILFGIAFMAFKSQTVYASPADPFLISTADDLKRFRDIVNGINGETQDVSLNAILLNDVDLANDPWIPIENYEGIFDGNGYSVDNLYIKDSMVDMGFFTNNKETSKILNLSVFGEITNEKTDAISRTGGITSQNRGVIYNVANYVRVTGYSYVAGIAAVNGGVIENCRNHWDINAKYTSSATGMVGAMAGYVYQNQNNPVYIKNCYSTDGVAGDVRFTGGIAGYVYTASTSYPKIEISNCFYDAPFWFENDSHVDYFGGIIGNLNKIDHTIISSNYYSDKYDNVSTGVYNSTDESKAKEITSDEFGLESTFVDWDFEKVWNMGTYNPELKTELDFRIGNTCVYGKTSGEGWAFDYDTNTLVLNNFSYTGDGSGIKYGSSFASDLQSAVIVYKNKDKLNIELAGTNTMVNTYTNTEPNNYFIGAVGIFSAGDLDISGDGSLEISFTGTGSFSYGIMTLEDMFISGISLDVTSGNSVYNDYSVALITSNYQSYIGLYDDIQGFNVIGKSNAISGNLTNSCNLTGWTNTLGTEGKATIEKTTIAKSDIASYKKITLILVTASDVISLIDDIGTVEYTGTSKDKIDAAREAYDTLDQAEQALVTNYDALTTAEAAYQTLKTNNDAADTIDALINAIGIVEYTLESKDTIDAAREAYNALTDAQKALVTKLNDLVAKENKYAALGTEALINAIGEVSDLVYPDSGDAIKAARDAYNALTDTEKELVSNYQHLLDDEAKYNSLKTTSLINNIGTVEYNEASKNKIDAARESYDNLTDTEKALVTNYNTLTTAETTYKNLADNDAADSVDTLILAIGIVTYPNSLSAISAAKEAYDSLTDAQKALVDNYDKLEAAEAKYEELELDATRHSLTDESGVMVETKDGTGIPKSITLMIEVTKTVAAEKGTDAYTNINSMLKGKKIRSVYDVKLIQTINNVETEVQPEDIKPGTTIIIHIGVPKGVNPKSAKILHIHSEDDLEFIENVEIVNNEFVFEVTRLSEFAIVTPKNSVPGYAIALIIVGSILLVCSISYILLFFVFNEWINKNGKAVRVFKIGKKETRIRLLLMPCKLEYKDRQEIFKTKEEALK